MRYLLSSHLGEILLAFEEARSTERLAANLRCSPSVVFRSLQAIADVGPFVVKVTGRWCITPLGRRMNVITRRAIRSQENLLNRPYSPIVGYSPALLSDICVALVHRVLLDQGCKVGGIVACDPLKAEERMACGEVDFFITNRVPISPAFRYHVLRTFKLLPVIAATKVASESPRGGPTESLPFVCSKYLDVPDELSQICGDSRARFEVEGIGTCLEYVGAGIGWSLIPSYLLANGPGARGFAPLLGPYQPPDQRLLVVWLRGKDMPSNLAKTLGSCFDRTVRTILSPSEVA